MNGDEKKTDGGAGGGAGKQAAQCEQAPVAHEHLPPLPSHGDGLEWHQPRHSPVDDELETRSTSCQGSSIYRCADAAKHVAAGGRALTKKDYLYSY